MIYQFFDLTNVGAKHVKFILRLAVKETEKGSSSGDTNVFITFWEWILKHLKFENLKHLLRSRVMVVKWKQNNPNVILPRSIKARLSIQIEFFISYKCNFVPKRHLFNISPLEDS